LSKDFLWRHIQHNYNDPDRQLNYTKLLFFCYFLDFQESKQLIQRWSHPAAELTMANCCNTPAQKSGLYQRHVISVSKQPIGRPCEVPSKMLKSSKIIIILIFPTRVFSGCALFRVSTWPKERNFKRLVFYIKIPWDFLSFVIYMILNIQ